MKNPGLLAIVLTLVLFPGCKGRKNDRNLNVITFNIRYDNPRDSINAWPNRMGIVCDFLKKENPDLLGLQEALWYQYEEIDSAISGYSSVAVGRDDGKKKGEMNPIFYNIHRFNIVRNNTFWLSETPDKLGSIGWGASLPRIVTWVELKDKETNKSLFYFNTHFAHDSDSARIMSARILLKEVKRIAGKNMFVISGDFNMTPGSLPYTILTESSSLLSALKDSYLLSHTKPEGPANTFNGWSDGSGENRIDYIFVRKGIKVLNACVIIKKEGTVFVSDHWPYKTIISLK
jgi:endonuclease/exonuclease/phosphatase family metal-dependent hydrolase